MPFLIILTIYAAMSLITLLTYALDKHRAIHHRRRIPERTLHLLELLGGWPGAALAQMLLHHKNRKLPYLLTFVAIILAHAAAWTTYLWLKWRA